MKNLNRYLKQYFTIWWVPILFYTPAVLVFYLGVLVRRDWVIDLALYLLVANLCGIFISCIVQIVIKKWYLIFPQIILTGFLFFLLVFIFTFSPPDYYGANKKIPEHIQIDEPLNNPPRQEHFEEHDLILTHSAQPGIYTYHTDFQPAESGFFYIRAFEVTSNDRLSADRMRQRSRVGVSNLNQEHYEGEFTIYEGSWGDKYGGRIELWFQPSSDNEEFKVAERNFIVEGWMR